MKAVLALICAAVFLPALRAGDWITLASDNFKIYTTSGERDARVTLETFEQVRDFFMRMKSSSLTTRLPVTIVGFRNAKEYKPFAPSEAASAYYIGDEQQDYIVMQEAGGDRTVAIHEYMHLLVRHTGWKMPVWLNEGFAEVYSTLKPLAGQILVGSFPEGRVQSLAGRKWLPLTVLFGAGHDSSDYNEKERAEIFYAQSWLLAHMLMLSPEYGQNFGNFVSEVSTSGSTSGAFTKVYGKSVENVEKDLNRYYHSNSLQGVLFKTRFAKVEIGPASPASDLDTGLALEAISMLIGHREEAAHRLEQLSAAYKDSYRIEEAKAYLDWRQGNTESAIKHFDSAIGMGAASWKTSWDFARLLNTTGGEPDKYQKALRKTLELNPGLNEARIMLGQELYRKRSYAQALLVLRELKSIEPDRASSVFLLIAYCAVEMNQTEEAKRYLEKARKLARTTAEIDGAQRLLAHLEKKDQAQQPLAALPAIDIPIAEKGISRPVEAPLKDNHVTITGRLVNLDCIDEVARMRIKAGDATLALLIRKPGEVIVRNTGSAVVNLTCGAQDAHVAVDYLPSTDPQYSTSGDVRAIEFLK